MNKTELLAELDKYLALREDPVFKKEWTLSNGHNMRLYTVKGIANLGDNRMDHWTIPLYVYREGEPQETAAFEGDPIEALWELQVRQYLEPFQGIIVRGYRPKIICRIVEGAPATEKWVLVTGTEPTEAPWQWSFAHEDATMIEFTF